MTTNTQRRTETRTDRSRNLSCSTNQGLQSSFLDCTGRTNRCSYLGLPRPQSSRTPVYCIFCVMWTDSIITGFSLSLHFHNLIVSSSWLLVRPSIDLFSFRPTQFELSAQPTVVSWAPQDKGMIAAWERTQSCIPTMKLIRTRWSTRLSLCSGIGHEELLL